jgi:serine/threonine protein kinase
MPLTSGARLGPYEIQSAIGAGGMGEVYRARDTRLNRDVAIKVLPESFAEDGDRLRRFQLEAQSAGALHDRAAMPKHVRHGARAPEAVRCRTSRGCAGSSGR